MRNKINIEEFKCTHWRHISLKEEICYYNHRMVTNLEIVYLINFFDSHIAFVILKLRTKQKGMIAQMSLQNESKQKFPCIIIINNVPFITCTSCPINMWIP